MEKIEQQNVEILDRLHLAKLIPEREFSLELLGKHLAAQGVVLSPDQDGDLYVSDAIIGFPFWVTSNRLLKVVILHTYHDYQAEQDALEALEAMQRLRLGPITPQFFLEGHSLFAHYFLSYRELLVISHVYEAACRFAEYASNMPFVVKGASEELRRRVH
jgi:hypothetical protein